MSGGLNQVSGYEIFVPNYALRRIGETRIQQSLTGACDEAFSTIEEAGQTALSDVLFQGERDDRGVMGLDSVFAQSGKEISPNGTRVIFSLRERVSLNAARARFAGIMGNIAHIVPHVSTERPDPMP